MFATGLVENNNWEVLVSLLGAAFAGVLCSDAAAVPQISPQASRIDPVLLVALETQHPAVLDFATTEEGKHCAILSPFTCSCVRLWHQFRRNVIDRPQLMEKVIRLKKLFFLAERHLDSAESEVRTLAQALFVNLEHPLHVRLPLGLSRPTTGLTHFSASPCSGGR